MVKHWEVCEIPKDKSLYGPGRERRLFVGGGGSIPRVRIRPFSCPKCGKTNLWISRNIYRKELNVRCSHCKFKSSFKVSEKGLYNVRQGYEEFVDDYHNNARRCSVCKDRISDGVYNYSMANFKKALCMNHQKTIRTSSPNSESSPRKKEESNVTRKDFLQEFFGSFGRDLGNPGRWFTNNPSDTLLFIEECARNKLPAFMSVQSEKDKSKPLGIEKVFFDFDYCKNFEILTEEEIKSRRAELENEVRFFLKQLEDRNIRPLVVRTRKGYHVHAYFDSVYEIDQQLKFWKKVYELLQLDLTGDHCYRFIDKAVIGDINRMCRIPLSVHEKSGEECIIVDNQLKPDKVRSIEYFKRYGLKQKDILSAIEKAREYEKNQGQKQVKYIARSQMTDISGIRPCFTKAMNSGEMCHRQRLALLSEAYSVGFHCPESIIDIYKCFNDFDRGITEYQVKWFFSHWVQKGDIRPYSCITIRGYGWCLGEDCPRFKNFKLKAQHPCI